MRRAIIVLMLVACSGASEVVPPADAGARCSPGSRSACACVGYEGVSTCLPEGRRGGCDCSRPSPDDGGAEPADASCDTPAAWYRDADGDGHGSGVATMACAAPAGYVAVDDDCDDADARAFPGQTAYFTTARAGGSYDFDCDKSEKKQYPTAGGANCTSPGGVGNCIGGGSKDYWEGSTVPDCGKQGAWMVDCSGTCSPMTEQRTQSCR